MSNATTPAQAAGTNVWDAVVALVVVGALVALAFKLVTEYGDDTEKITSVLGVAAPVLAAAFGVSIGYFSGKAKGQATGEEEGKRKALEIVAPHVEALDATLQPGAETADDQGVRSHVDQLKGALSAAR